VWEEFDDERKLLKKMEMKFVSIKYDGTIPEREKEGAHQKTLMEGIK
jgi:hypothetical protein